MFLLIYENTHEVLLPIG